MSSIEIMLWWSVVIMGYLIYDIQKTIHKQREKLYKAHRYISRLEVILSMNEIELPFDDRKE